jgi:hypothetical protein
MAKDHIVWVVHWTRRDYGGLSSSAQPSEHLTLEGAEAFKQQREGDPLERSDMFFEHGFQYTGSRPTPKVVGKAEYGRIKARRESQ